ncbi:MAG: chitobiase/beta-hexosaminidase C-terminal domain-containing protein, partial [Gammaproteobacteria bacterium]|nr:chitobiase/beta-hexosaminidase C-terminal domain-containing protein [Gammaproteobacteria bacterium]
SAVPKGGIDGYGDAYSATLLGSSLTWNGATFMLGAAGSLDALASATIPLPAGAYSSLSLLASGVDGNQPNQVFTVNYSDGTSASFTQSLSDWHTPQNYVGESTVLTMPYRLSPSGAVDNRTFYLYGYSFALNSAKIPVSLTLPTNRHVVVLALDLTPAAGVQQPAATPTLAPAPGTYGSAQSVTLADTTAGASIYYTTNGSTPTTSSTLYSGTPVPVSSSETIQAIAVASGYANSAVASGAYAINSPAATPTFAPAPGTYGSAQSVTLADSTAGASIYYTTNGSTPTTSSTLYSGTPIPVSSSETIQAIAAASGYANSAVAGGTYVINTNTTAATEVSLVASANVDGIVSNGSAVPKGGMDGYGNAYSATLLGTSLVWNGNTYMFGAPGSADAVANATIPLPAGTFGTLSLLATGVDGNQPNQLFTVNYSDGTSASFTQSLSDWFAPQNYPGEVKALSMPYRLNPSGAVDNRTFYLYGYSFALNSAKTAVSLTLPGSRHVVVLAVDLQ